MSCTVLKKKGYEAPSLFSNLKSGAEDAWGAVSRMVVINRGNKDDFRIPDPSPPTKRVKGEGVGHCYKKSGALRK
jgi:hypothetical protein